MTASIFDQLFWEPEDMKTAAASAKKSGLSLNVEQAPEQTFDEWKAEQIRLGLDDIAAGRVISHDEMVKRSDARLKRLIKKHGATA